MARERDAATLAGSWESTVVPLLVVALIAGVIVGIAPCAYPMAALVFLGAATTKGRSAWRRSLSLVLGVVVSFSLVILVGAKLVVRHHLSAMLLRDVGIGILIVLGVGLVVPWLGELLARPISRIELPAPNGSIGGFVIGLAIGLVFLPIAGPVLSTISTLGLKDSLDTTTILVTVVFALGATLPWLLVSLFSSTLFLRIRPWRRHIRSVRRVAGVALIAMAVTLHTDALGHVQREVPRYIHVLQRRYEETSKVAQQLATLTETNNDVNGTLATCTPGNPSLLLCGQAPNFVDVTHWINTPHGESLNMSSLRGKVVLVEFWSYSNINSVRMIAHLEAWYRTYHRDGLVIVGVHTPEFGFEHALANVKSEVKALGITYPVAMDNHDATWNAYEVGSWPSDYLIDANGVVRHVETDEGDYTITERLIRQLLVSAQPRLQLPPPTHVANLTPAEPTNPQTFVGYNQLQFLDNTTTPQPNQPTTLRFPRKLTSGEFAFSGTWTDHKEEATSGKRAMIELSYSAKDVYAVMGGSGTVQVSSGRGRPLVVRVGGVPRLYPIRISARSSTGRLVVRCTPGVEIYDFSFG
ncbi:MAG: redoxin domain-containing protein [Acidimicrobiales bacterium]